MACKKQCEGNETINNENVKPSNGFTVSLTQERQVKALHTHTHTHTQVKRTWENNDDKCLRLQMLW